MSNLRRRIDRLEQARGGDTVEVEKVMVYRGGEMLEMTPAEWLEYERTHPGDYISITEWPEDV